MSGNHCAFTQSEVDKRLKEEKAEVTEVVVNPGEVLFIPEGWWHSVVSTGATAAVNFWFNATRVHLCNPRMVSVCYICQPTVNKFVFIQAPYYLRTTLESMVKRKVGENVEANKETAAAVLHLLQGKPAFEKVVTVFEQLSPVHAAAVSSLLDNAGPDFLQFLFPENSSGTQLKNLLLGKAEEYHQQALTEIIAEFVFK